MLSDLMKEDLIKGLLDIFSGDIEAIILYGSVARNSVFSLSRLIETLDVLKSSSILRYHI